MAKESDLVQELHLQGFKTFKIKKANPAKLQKEADKYNSELEARARKKEDLIIPVELAISAVRFYGSGNRTFTPSFERHYGGISPEYPLGDSYSCEFDVTSLTKIKKLSFIGWPSLEADNKIRAYIFAGEEKGKKYVQEWGPFGPRVEEVKRDDFSKMNYPQVDNPFVFVQREFNDQERALKIEKLNNLGNVVATWIDSGLSD